MIQLASKILTPTTQKALNDLQQKIDAEKAFNKKVAKAQSLWNSKGGTTGKKVFKIISKELYSMCLYIGVCNYCEQSEANDIEHIYPKSFFPEYTFDWQNYLLACKQCNSAYKLDKCFVLDGNNNIVAVKRGTSPQHKVIAFLNPRLTKDNPSNFMLLDMQTYRFILLPNLKKKDASKAQSTLDILQLNHRSILLQARKSAGIYYYQRLKLLIELQKAKTIAEIENLLTPYDDKIDKSLNLKDLKKALLDSFHIHISKYQHPSVWQSIKLIESKVNTKWKAIFKQIPVTLTW